MVNADEGVAATIRVRDHGEAHLVAAGGRELADEGGAGGSAGPLVVMMIPGTDESAVGAAVLPRTFFMGLIVVDRHAGQGLRRFAGAMAFRGFLGGGMFQDLTVGHESFAQRGVGDVLDGQVSVDRQHGGRGGGLAEDHEDGLHADRTVGDVRGAAGDRREEVGDLAAFRHQGAVGDGVG